MTSQAGLCQTYLKPHRWFSHDRAHILEMISNIVGNYHDRVKELCKAIVQLMKIARHLKARRVRGGALELESVEVQIQLTETKSIENLNPKDVSFFS